MSRLKYILVHNIAFHILTLLSVALIFISFFVPPQGVIDGSVLAAVGEIFGFAALGTVLEALERGVDAKVTKGDTTVVLESPDKKERGPKF